MEEAAEVHLSFDGPRRARRLPHDVRLRGHPGHQRADRRHVAVPCRRGRDPDLRRAEDRELRPRHLLHAGRLRRLYRARRNRQLHACGAVGRAGDGAVRRAVRTRPDQPRLRLQRADAAPDLLRRGADLRRPREDRLGARVPRHGNAGGLPGAAAVHRRRRGAAVLRRADRHRRADRDRARPRPFDDAARQDGARRRDQSADGFGAGRQHDAAVSRSSSPSAAGWRGWRARSRRPCARCRPAWASRS